MTLPPRANDAFEVLASESGFVVHDAEGGTVHYLNETAAIVFSLCDGVKDPAEIAAALANLYHLDAPPGADVTAALDQLRAIGLVI